MIQGSGGDATVPGGIGDGFAERSVEFRIVQEAAGHAADGIRSDSAYAGLYERSRAVPGSIDRLIPWEKIIPTRRDELDQTPDGEHFQTVELYDQHGRELLRNGEAVIDLGPYSGLVRPVKPE